MTYKIAAAIGPAGDAVRLKVRALRCKRGLSLRAMETETEQAGRKLSADVINKIELGIRRIDIDDLFTLAAALSVAPAHLLEPPERCSACRSEPPAGFACLACGATAPVAVGDRS